MILPQDDISSSNEVTFTPRLGLPLIPRANKEALAALNSAMRILDERVLKQGGDVGSGDYLFTGNITHSGNTELNTATVQELTVISAIVGEGIITDLTSDTAEITTAVVQDLTAPVLKSADSTIEVLKVTSYEKKFDRRAVTVPSGEVVNIAMGFTAQLINYKAVVSPVGSTYKHYVTGSLGEVGPANFAVPSGDIDNVVGEGMPQLGSSDLIVITIEGDNIKLSAPVDTTTFLLETSRH